MSDYCVPGSQFLLSDDPNCPGMGPAGDAVMQAFLTAPLDIQIPEAPAASVDPETMIGDPLGAAGQQGPFPGETFILATGPTYETSAQTGAMLLTPLAAPAAESGLMTGEEVLGGLLARSFVPSGGALGTSLFSDLIAGTEFVPGAAADVLGTGPLAPLVGPLTALELAQASITPEVIAQTGLPPPGADLAGTLDIAGMFPSLQPQIPETQPELTPPPPPDVRPVATLTQDQLAQPTPNIGDIIVTAPVPSGPVQLQLPFYDPTAGYAAGPAGSLQPAPRAAPQPAPQPAPGGSVATAPLVADPGTLAAVLAQPSPAPAASPATASSPLTEPSLASDQQPKPTWSASPSPTASTQPLTQPQPQPQRCEPPKKTRSKRKPRTVCHRGTYVEHTRGLSKSPKEEIECQ